MLEAHERAGSFLEPPDRTISRDATAADGTDLSGTAIGPYRLLQPIGEGGMGAVYMAEQREPVRRMVALKVVKAGMDTRQVLARFTAERQALALMDHPNIAKVFDAGTTAQGRPYFVMELVKGVPITRFCDERKLGPRERLELMIPVCQAVQHAHQKGVIHRDLKPSNVLVALYDGVPVPKVIDFGVAKAIGQKLTEATLFTGFGAIVGTPEYMSPEQAELNQLDVDTRSDIYSLGVLLYELLTGSTPLDRRRMKQAALLEVLRLIREEEPPRPSTRLGTTEELPTIAASRGVEPRKLSNLVRGELDWIVMKAIEKDRNRRYETANGVAVDLRRYLDNEPVAACPPSAAYRLRKLIARNRAAALGACVVLATLLAGVAVSSYFALLASARAREADANARTARESEKATAAHAQRAVQQTAIARANLERAREAIDRMLTRVSEEQLINTPQMEGLRQGLLQDAVRLLESELAGEDKDPAARLRAGASHYRLARLYQAFDLGAEAEQHFRKAIGLLAGYDSVSPPDFEAGWTLVEAHRFLMYALRDQGRHAEKLREHIAALDVAERLRRDDPRAELHDDPLVGLYLAWCEHLRMEGRRDEGDPWLEKARQVASRPGREALLAFVFHGLAYLALERSQLDAARAHYEESRRLFDVALARDADSHPHRSGRVQSLAGLADVAMRRGTYRAALAPQREAVAMAERLAREYPRSGQYAAQAVGFLLTLARIEQTLGDEAAAESSLEKAGRLYINLARSQSLDAWHMTEAAHCFNQWHRLAAKRGQEGASRRVLASFDEFAEASLKALGRQEAAAGTERPLNDHLALAYAALVLGRDDTANRVLDGLRRLDPDQARSTPAKAYLDAGWNTSDADPRRAATLFGTGIALLDQAPVGADRDRLDSVRAPILHGWAICLDRLEQPVEAEQRDRQAEWIIRQRLVRTPTVDVRAELASILHQRGARLRFAGRAAEAEAEAETCLVEAIELARSLERERPDEWRHTGLRIEAHHHLSHLLGPIAGRESDADAHHRSEVELCRRGVERMPDDFHILRLADAHNWWAGLLRDHGRGAESEASLAAAIAVLEGAVAHQPDHRELAAALARTWLQVGDIALSDGRRDRAADAFLSAGDAVEALVALVPSDRSTRGELWAIQERLLRLWLGDTPAPAEGEAACLRALRRRPESASARTALGMIWLALGAFDRAQAEFERGRLPRGPIPPREALFRGIAAACAGDGDGASLDRLGRQLLDQHPTRADVTDGGFELVLAACLMPDRPDEAARWAEAVPGRWLEDRLSVPWGAFAAGLAHFRARNDRTALDRLRRSLEIDAAWSGGIPQHALMALAHHRLGEAEAARAALGEATTRVDRLSASLLDLPPGRYPMFWWDWWVSLRIYREAQAAIEGRAADDPRWDVARARCLEAVGHHDEANAEIRRAIASTRRDPALRLACAVALASGDRWETALEFLADPTDRSEDRSASARRRHLRGRILADHARAAEALKDLQTAQQEAPDDPEIANDLAWLRLDAALADSADPKRAQALAEKAVSLAPENGRYQRTLGVARYSAGDTQGALAALTRAVELSGAGGIEAFHLAMINARRGDAETARGWSEKAVAWAEGNASTVTASPRLTAELTRLRQESSRLIEKSSQGAESWQAQVRENPGDADGWLALARAYERTKAWSKAADAYAYAVERWPREDRFRWKRAEALRFSGRLEDSVREHTTAIDQASTPTAAFPWCYLGRAMAYSALDRPDQAVGDLDRAIELWPRLWDTWTWRGEYFHNRLQWERAVADLSKAAELNPGNAYVRMMRGHAYASLGRREEAFAEYRKSLEGAPPAGAAEYNTLAWYLATCAEPGGRDPRWAVELATRATELVPREAASWNTLGAAQYRAGHLRGALDALTLSTRRSDGGDAFDWLLLATVHAKLGHADEARALYDRSVAWLADPPERIRRAPILMDELGRFRAEAEEALGLPSGPR